MALYNILLLYCALLCYLFLYITLFIYSYQSKINFAFIITVLWKPLYVCRVISVLQFCHTDCLFLILHVYE